MRELEPEEINALLTFRPEPTQEQMSRRTFLKLLGAGVAVSAIPWSLMERAKAEALGSNQGILVIVNFSGGNDALNSIVPIGNPTYHDIRKTIGFKENEVLPIGNGFGLHPSLKTVKKLYDVGKVGLIQGVDYSKPDMSHFQSSEYWMSGWYAGGMAQSGWLGRYFDSIDAPSLISGAAVGVGVPLHLLGSKGRASSVPYAKGGVFGLPTAGEDQVNSHDARLYRALPAMYPMTTGHGEVADYVSSTAAKSLQIARPVANCYPNDASHSGEFAGQMQVAANIVNSNMVRVVATTLGGFDTHVTQQNPHKQLMSAFDDGIAAFYKTLKPAMAKRVSIVTFSDFGRRASDNGSGTDHGTAMSMFLIGDNVMPGILGEPPSLKALDPTGNLKATTSVYSVYSTIAEKWLGGDGKEVVGTSLAPLPIYKRAPGQA